MKMYFLDLFGLMMLSGHHKTVFKVIISMQIKNWQFWLVTGSISEAKAAKNLKKMMFFTFFLSIFLSKYTSNFNQV